MTTTIDPLRTCNACDARPMRPGCEAGLCVRCEQSAHPEANGYAVPIGGGWAFVCFDHAEQICEWPNDDGAPLDLEEAGVADWLVATARDGDVCEECAGTLAIMDNPRPCLDCTLPPCDCGRVPPHVSDEECGR